MKKGWELKRLGHVCKIGTGKSNTEDAVENGAYAFFDRSKIIKRSSRFLFDCEAIIIAGEGQTFLPKFYSGKFDLHQRAYAIYDFDNSIDIKYTFKFLTSCSPYFEKVAVGATAKSLRLRHFEELLVPVPPRHEQERIVEILDEVFANIDRNLQNAKDLFQSQLHDIFLHAGNGWVECTLNDVCSLITDGTHYTPKYLADGVPFLSVKNLTKGFIDFSDTKFISLKEHQILTKRCKPVRDDILYTKVGTTGIAKVIDVDEEFSIFVSVALLKLKKDVIDNVYLEHYLNSPIAREQAKKRTRGMANKNLVIRDIKEIVIHYPKEIKKQKEISKLVSHFLERNNELQGQYVKKLELIDKLKKSILQQAFTGELKLSRSAASV